VLSVNAFKSLAKLYLSAFSAITVGHHHNLPQPTTTYHNQPLFNRTKIKSESELNKTTLTEVENTISTLQTFEFVKRHSENIFSKFLNNIHKFHASSRRTA